MSKKYSENGRHKYAVIVKHLLPNTGEAKFYKCHVSNLVKLCEYLDIKFPSIQTTLPYKTGWKWFNVYEYKYETGVKLASFSIKNRPSSPFL